MQAETLIVGGGLAGLSLADVLQHQGRDYLVLESRSRLGGRILTESVGGIACDLGPAWFWPQLNPRLTRLAADLGVAIFPQHQKGGMVLQSPTGYIHRHAQSWVQNPRPMRFRGGAQALVMALAARLDPKRLRTAAKVLALHSTADGVSVHYQTEQGAARIQARQVVLALPPRLCEQQFEFAPALPAGVQERLRQLPTWMASHAKAVAVYDRAFWREYGQSGLAISQCGPLAEIHDASPADGSSGVLFGFFAWPARERAQRRDTLEQAVREQLVQLFGEAAARPTAVCIKDWAEDAATAVPSDILGEAKAPEGGVSAELGDDWHSRLFFAGSETAMDNGGYLEGALEAVEHCLQAMRVEALA